MHLSGNSSQIYEELLFSAVRFLPSNVIDCSMDPSKTAASFISFYVAALTSGAFPMFFLERAGLLKRMLCKFWVFLYTPKVWLINTCVFLIALWVVGHEKIEGMMKYLSSRKTILSYLLLLTYLAAILGLLGGNAYPQLSLLLVAFIILFPLFFPTDKIQNPTTTKRDGLSLMGKGGQVLPINSPELGVFIVGSPGCGKTKYVIEPLLSKMIAQGYSGILYDYDFSVSASKKNYSLSQLAYNCCRNYTDNKTCFVSINFQDLTISSRINPIASARIRDRKKLSNLLHTFLVNMNPNMSQRQDFWYKNTYAFLKSLIVFLANNYPQYCTLPHVVMLGLQPQKSIFKILKADREARLYASPILDAFELPGEQLAGVMANVKVMLERLLDHNLFWVLSGDDVPHIVNDPMYPLLGCLGNTPTEKELVSPVLSMIAASLISNMYSHDRNKSFLMIDELPTILLPNLNEIPATARKYGIATIVALQNLSQLENRYSKIGAEELQETFSNHLIGRSQLRLAKNMSDMFGKEKTQVVSTTNNSQQQVSETIHHTEKSIMTPQEVMNLGVGEFVGKVAGSDKSFFRMKLEPIGAYDDDLIYGNLASMPAKRQTINVAANFSDIQKNVELIVDMHH